MFVERHEGGGRLGSRQLSADRNSDRHAPLPVRGSKVVSYDARTSALRQASCRISGHPLIADRSDWPTLDLKTHTSHVN
jgi:hypothetical protein